MERRRVRVSLVAMAAAAAVGLAGCGSSSGGGGSNNGGGGGSVNAEGVSDTSITVEGDIVKTSAIGYSQSLAEIGAKARFERANKDGGVNGRTIDYLGSVDNKLDPSQDLPTVKKIVQQDKAFAVVPLISPVLSTGGKYLIDNKVPFFGWGITPSFCNGEYGFGFTGCLVPSNKDNLVSGASAGLMQKLLGVEDGSGKSVAIVSEDSTSGKFGVKVIEAAFKAYKWNVVYAKSAIPAGAATTDFTPYSQAILTSNAGKAPDVVVHVTTAPNVIGLTQALKNSGFKGPQENAVTYDPKYLATAQSRQALEGAYVFLQYGSFQEDTEANKTMLADVKAVDPKQTELTQDIAIGYYSADIFLNGVKKAGKDLTRESFIKAMNDGEAYEVPGGIGKISYPDAHKNSVPCGSLVQIVDGKYVSKVPLTCFTNVPLSAAG